MRPAAAVRRRTMTRLTWSLLLLAGAIAACTRGGIPIAPAIESTAPVSSPIDELRHDVSVLASDSLGGRATGSEGERRAVRYLAGRARDAGLTPAGDSGGFIQRVPLARERLGSRTRLVVRGPRSEEFTLSSLLPLLELGSRVPDPRRTVDDAEIVFAGYGADPASLAARGIPIAGRVAVIVNGAPATAGPIERAQLESPGAIAPRLARLFAERPAAVIVLLAGASAEAYDATLRDLYARRIGPAERSTGDSHGDTSPMVLFGKMPTGRSPLLPRHWPSDDRSQLLDGYRFTGTVDIAVEPVAAYNVVAALPATDSSQRRHWVALAAHLDHLGILSNTQGDSVAHGADDDASGSAALLAVARRLAHVSQRRSSVLFIWHTGEEEGQLGSRYFALHPTVPIDSVRSLVDADMVGRNASDSLFFVGPVWAMSSPEGRLLATLDSANASMDRPFAVGRVSGAASDSSSIYYRTDAWPYADRGVPAALVTSGAHEDFHQVTDVASRVDYDKVDRVSMLLAAFALRVDLNGPHSR